MEDFSIVRLTPAHLPVIRQLIRDCFGHWEAPERIAQRYGTDRFWKPVVGYLAFSPEGRPAAYYGVFPVAVQAEGETLMAAQSGDTMTHPDYRKRGLFVRLAEATYHTAAEEGIRFVFGFPNEHSLPGFRDKLGWEFHGALHSLSTQSRSSRLSLLLRRSVYRGAEAHRLLRRISVQPDEKALKGSGDSGGYHVRHDADFFTYKKSPDVFLVRFQGFLMLVKAGITMEVGWVADFPSSRIAGFLAAVKNLAMLCGSPGVALHLSGQHGLYPVIRSCVQEAGSAPAGFRTLSGPALPYQRFTFCGADADVF